MTGQQLKNSILQLAIQGKLVPQDANDEPANELLKRIREEKEKLVKEKKLKKSTLEVTPISEDEIPFEIPEKWVWCRLENVFSMQAGKNISASELSQEKTINHSYPCYGGNGIRGYIGKYNTEGVHCIVGRQGALCGNVKYTKGQFYATEHAVVVDTYSNTSVKWALYFLTASNLNQYATATAQPGLAVSTIMKTLLPLPPLQEQYRIVQKIEELMPLVDEYDKAQVELNTLNANLPEALKKSILQEAIQGKLGTNNPDDEPASELLKRIKAEKAKLIKEKKIKKEKPLPEITEDEKPFEIPENWVWCYIGDLFMHNNGKQLNKSNAHGIMMDYITTSHLYWDGFVLDNIKQMPFEENEIERCQAVKGDLLICEGGDIGRACIWRHDNPIMLQNHIHKCRAYIPLATDYFYYIFYYYNKTKQIGGKGIGIQGFSSKALHKTLIPLPPLQEQHRIVEKLNEILPKLKTM